MRLSPTRHRAACCLLAASTLCASARAQVLEAPIAQAPLASIPLDASVRFKPFRDPWRPARERWRDIADNPLSGFLSGAQKFSYENPVPQVTLSYSRAPQVPYFIGRIDALGLKPNFAYQMKLAGKPTRGARGWGAFGHEASNEALGYAGRWWCGHLIHASGTNFDDAHYLNEYKNAPRGMEHDIYGYIYMGQFITDGRGEAHHTFFGDHPYHISWHSWQGSANWTAWQGGAKDVLAFRPQVLAAPLSAPDGDSFYGYGATAPSTSVTLFYENEPGRVQPLTLPPGDYHARFLITEESFHNPVASDPEGGYWKTVLASEDFSYDESGHILAPDSDGSNDVNFTIGPAPSVRAMRGRIEVRVARPRAGFAKATARVLVTDAIGRPIRGARVTGQWLGLHQQVPVSSTTNSTGIGGLDARGDGLAQFSTPEVRARRGCFGFVVTNVSKAGRTWNGGQQPGVQGCL